MMPADKHAAPPPAIGPDGPVAYFLKLRLHFRRNPEARAVVDRCLMLLAQAEAADEPARAELTAEVEALHDDLIARFGPPPWALRH